LLISVSVSSQFWDGWPQSPGYLDWLCITLLVPQPVFIILAGVFFLTEKPRVITEQLQNPDRHIRKLY
jgi:hypothetical protein